MTAINHALTGAAIGMLVANPALALPLAFVSHFVCDALPHYGNSQSDDIWLKSRRFKQLLIVDASLCVMLVLVLGGLHVHNWLIVSLCAFLATSPDLFWINSFRLRQANKPWHPNLYSRFAAKIQWFQRPVGAVAEAGWFIAGLFVIGTLAGL